MQGPSDTFESVARVAKAVQTEAHAKDHQTEDSDHKGQLDTDQTVLKVFGVYEDRVVAALLHHGTGFVLHVGEDVAAFPKAGVAP